MDDRDEYELLSHEKAEHLRHEVQRLKEDPFIKGHSSQKLLSAVQQLTDSVQKLYTLFEHAEKELLEENTVPAKAQSSEKVDKLLEQNRHIAQGILKIAEKLGETHTEIENEKQTSPQIKDNKDVFDVDLGPHFPENKEEQDKEEVDEKPPEPEVEEKPIVQEIQGLPKPKPKPKPITQEEIEAQMRKNEMMQEQNTPPRNVPPQMQQRQPSQIYGQQFHRDSPAQKYNMNQNNNARSQMPRQPRNEVPMPKLQPLNEPAPSQLQQQATMPQVPIPPPNINTHNLPGHQTAPNVTRSSPQRDPFARESPVQTYDENNNTKYMNSNYPSHTNMSGMPNARPSMTKPLDVPPPKKKKILGLF